MIAFLETVYAYSAYVDYESIVKLKLWNLKQLAAVYQLFESILGENI